MLSGALVAGLDGGTIYNTWPTMGGYWLTPPDYWHFGADSVDALDSPTGGNANGNAMPRKGWWKNAFENPAASQFHHRFLVLPL